MNVRLHIEKLILDGLSLEPGQGAVVKAAVEAELTRLLVEGGSAPEFGAGGARAYASGGEFRAEPGDTPEVLGSKIGRAVNGGIGP